MKKVLVGTICLLLCGAPAAADTIYLKSGRVIHGRKVIHQTPVYIRVKPRFLGDPEREFLRENVERIVIGNDGTVPTKEVLGYVSANNLDDVPEEIKLAARQMAVSLLEQAMQSVIKPSLEDAPENVKRAAEQKASDLLSSAMASLNETPDNVKVAAREIANSLLEETVRTTSVNSIDEVSDDVKRVAQEKAGALIEQAMVDTVEEAPNQVKIAAKLKARALIEDAMREINILEGVISDGQSVQDRFEVSSIIQRNKQQKRSQVTTFDREIDGTEIDSLMDEAVQRRVREEATFDFENVPGTMGMVEQMVVAPDPSAVHQMQNNTQGAVVTEDPKMVATQDSSDGPPAEVRVLSEDEMKAKIATIPQPNMKGLGFQDFITALTYRDYTVMGLCIVLLLILLGQQSRSRRKKKGNVDEPDIQVVSSVTFQHLPEGIKSKFTSSDITMILDLEDQFRHKSGLESGESFVDDENLLKFIQDQAQKAGGIFSLVDLKKILEVKEKTITETGIA